MTTDAEKEPLKQVRDRAAIIDLTHQLAECVDSLQWEALEAHFTDDVSVNHPYVVRNGPVDITSEEFIKRWKEAMSSFETTQHLITNHQVGVENDTATCAAYLHAQHFYPEDHGDSFWTLGGHYDLELIRADDGWRIIALIMTELWAEGNQYLLRQVGK